MGNDKTKWIFDDKDVDRSLGGSDDFTESIGHTDPGAPTLTEEAGPTHLMGDQGGKTEILHAGNRERFEKPHGMAETTDPVVGWLVVVKGPGLGRSVTLGVGVNAIGRDGAERVALPFGDTLLSARDHARIYYDDEERAFHIGHGTGKNITRVNGAIVGNMVPLENFALIQLTKATHLRFVAFCNADFDWNDLQGADDPKPQ